MSLNIIGSVSFEYHVKDGGYRIRYKFVWRDFDIWFNLFEKHVENIDDYKLYDSDGNLITFPRFAENVECVLEIKKFENCPII